MHKKVLTRATRCPQTYLMLFRLEAPPRHSFTIRASKALLACLVIQRWLRRIPICRVRMEPRAAFVTRERLSQMRLMLHLPAHRFLTRHEIAALSMPPRLTHALAWRDRHGRLSRGNTLASCALMIPRRRSSTRPPTQGQPSGRVIEEFDV